tara:strand:- start:931 stop:1146 length:216 start_codon:yes stop_codon:yes gene_type:complete
MKTKIQTTARVQVTLSIKLDAPWSAESKLEDVWRQGSQEAHNTINNLIQKHGRITMVGEPVVMAVTNQVNE